MSKEKFLMELREYLSILENQEQEDILAEYAQHIDMKMQKGLSEEEAIRDFGPMQELASEILEAYHVKPEFRRKGSVLKLPVPGTNKAESGESFLKRGFDWIKKKTAAIVHGIAHGFRWLGEKCRTAGRWLRKLFTGRRGRVRVSGDTKENAFNMEETGKGKGRAGGFWKTAGHGIAVLCEGLAAFCIFLLKFIWNAGWLMFSGFCACVTIVILMGAGAILVFLLQGFPLAGIFMICLGGLLCFGTLSCGAFSMLIRKKKDNEYEEAKEPDKEGHYEQTA